MTEAAPAWAAMKLRLDPFALPHAYRYETGGGADEAAVILERHRALIARRLPRSGLPLAMRMPLGMFEGIAARSFESLTGATVVTLELKHRDPALSLPLLVSESIEDAASDWKAWAKVLSLPLLMIHSDGAITPVESRLGSVVLATVKPRRRSSMLGKRKAAARHRRRNGRLGTSELVIGREIASWERTTVAADAAAAGQRVAAKAEATR